MLTVRAPATTANLGPGFDCLGMALNLHNYISMDFRSEGLKIEVEGEGEAFIPQEEKNIVYQAALQVFEEIGEKPKGLYVKLKNNIPVARGLGSSAAAIVGGLVAANLLTGNKLTKDHLLKMAVSVEGHPDNVAPALYGGIVLAVEGRELVYHRFSPPSDLKVVVAVPDFTLSTQKARSVLPSHVPFKDAVFNVSHMGLLIAAFSTGNLGLLPQGMQDQLHQKYRNELIPGMEKVFEAAKTAGALAVVLSGAGPTLIAFTRDNMDEIARAMSEQFLRQGVKCKAYEIKPQPTGTEIITNGGKMELCH